MRVLTFIGAAIYYSGIALWWLWQALALVLISPVILLSWLWELGREYDRKRRG